MAPPWVRFLAPYYLLNAALLGAYPLLALRFVRKQGLGWSRLGSLA